MKKFILCFLFFTIISSVRAQFEEQSGISFDNINSDALWGDYNNDGWLDVFAINRYGDGSSYAPTPNGLFENNGDGTFSKLSYNYFVGIACYAIWGDFNNDNYLDIIASGSIWHGAHTGLYLNNGDKTFKSSFDFGTVGSNGESEYEIASGDFDNDGKLDVLYKDIDRAYNRPWKYVIFQNNGNGVFSQNQFSLIDYSYNPGACGDFNNDGYVDLILSQKDTLLFYKNNGDGSFYEKSQIGLYFQGRIYCADLNNDGFLDVIISEGDSTRIYKNNGNETFSKSTLIPFYGKSSLGDYDNDGYLDILMVNSVQSKIYKNYGDFTFTEITNVALPGGVMGGAWGDYNNDGYLDIWINGKIFKNVDTINIKKNTPPSAPSNPQQTIDFNCVILKWDKTTDVQSGSKGLSYNIRMGTKPGFTDIISPMSSISSGFRQLYTIGNAEYVTDGFQIKNLSPGTYYWSVQAIDNAYSGGAWSEEKTFTISDTNTKIQDEIVRNITFYPNPAKNFIRINLGKSEPCKLTISDLNGRELFVQQVKSNDNIIYLKNLVCGLYLIKFQVKNDNVIEKLIIE
jgi:hypothetical protein